MEISACKGFLHFFYQMHIFGRLFLGKRFMNRDAFEKSLLEDASKKKVQKNINFRFI
jgi:hypothetical protein